MKDIRRSWVEVLKRFTLFSNAWFQQMCVALPVFLDQLNCFEVENILRTHDHKKFKPLSTWDSRPPSETGGFLWLMKLEVIFIISVFKDMMRSRCWGWVERKYQLELGSGHVNYCRDTVFLGLHFPSDFENCY